MLRVWPPGQHLRAGLGPMVLAQQQHRRRQCRTEVGARGDGGDTLGGRHMGLARCWPGSGCQVAMETSRRDAAPINSQFEVILLKELFSPCIYFFIYKVSGIFLDLLLLILLFPFILLFFFILSSVLVWFEVFGGFGGVFCCCFVLNFVYFCLVWGFLVCCCSCCYFFFNIFFL